MSSDFLMVERQQDRYIWKSFSWVFVQGVVSPLKDQWLGCVWYVVGCGVAQGNSCIHFSPPQQSRLPLLSILSMLEFSLLPFMRSFVFLSLSLDCLLCNIYGELISSHSDNSSGPRVMIKGYYSHSFHPPFLVRQSWSCCHLTICCTNNRM